MGCFGASIVILLSVMFALKWNQTNFLKRGAASDTDFYEVLKVESSATASDIKLQYKKLTRQWHPDKNPGCDECAAIFQQVVEAYEVLGDADKREAYDSSIGYIQKLKSKTHELTEANFDRLVVESSDFWVIQVYVSGNKLCESMSPIWEEVAQVLSSTAKFGRINAETASGLLQRLPYSIRLHPTVLTYARGERSELFPIDPPFVVSRLAKFIQGTIPNLVNSVVSGELFQAKAEFLASDLQVLIVFDKSTPDLKDLAFRHREYLQFAVSREVTKPTVVVKVEAETLEVQVSNMSAASLVEIVTANSLVPLYKENYLEVCAHNCILLFKDSPTLRRELAARINRGAKDYNFAIVDTHYHPLPESLLDKAGLAYDEAEEYVEAFDSAEQIISWVNLHSKPSKVPSSLGFTSIESFIRLRSEPWNLPVNSLLLLSSILTAVYCIFSRPK
jgi:hypothetical protein